MKGELGLLSLCLKREKMGRVQRGLPDSKTTPGATSTIVFMGPVNLAYTVNQTEVTLRMACLTPVLWDSPIGNTS